MNEDEMEMVVRGILEMKHGAKVVSACLTRYLSEEDRRWERQEEKARKGLWAAVALLGTKATAGIKERLGDIILEALPDASSLSPAEKRAVVEKCAGGYSASSLDAEAEVSEGAKE